MAMAIKKGVLSENEKDFIKIINKGKPDDIKKFMNLGDIRTDCLDETGMTPLCHAAYKGLEDICSLLLLRGANANSREHDSEYTPLMFAVMSGSVEIVHLLMAAGANPDVENKAGRTAAQLAGFINQHECSIVINSYVRRQEIDYFTVPRGFEVEPKLPPRLAAPLHRYLLQTNLTIYWLAKYLVTEPEGQMLIDKENCPKVIRVIDSMIERECKSQELNEMRVMKIHFLECVLQLVVKELEKSGESGEDNEGTPEWLRSLIRPSVLDSFAKKTIGNFPYNDLALLRQIMHQIKTAPPHARNSAALHSVLMAIGGRMYDRFSLSESCGTCGTRNVEKQCSRCREVVYCNGECQRIHWPVHKKFCKEPKEDADASACPFQAKMEANAGKTKEKDLPAVTSAACPYSGKTAENTPTACPHSKNNQTDEKNEKTSETEKPVPPGSGCPFSSGNKEACSSATDCLGECENENPSQNTSANDQ